MTRPLLVNGKPFFGRVEEQKRFRAALHEVLNPPHGETLPYVFLLYGDGGIGKTTLARRFRDIARQERPFAGRVAVLWVDWEEERRRHVALQVDREHIEAEVVFDILYTAAQRQGWEKAFKAYQDTLRKRRRAEKAAAQALAAVTERPDLAALRGVSATVAAKILRRGLPFIGESGERLAQAWLEAGIQAGAEELAALRQKLEAALRARLGVEQYDLMVNPLEGLARALADGFKRVAARQALLVVLDTYEIVDAVDPWVRMVLQLAGPRLLWVLSGRNDLVRSRLFGRTWFKGYAEDWPRRLEPINMSQLARQDVAAYFAAQAPQRPLEPEALDLLVRATRGIPLAVAQAADMWARDVPLANIVAEADEATPARDIVMQMTARYLLHAVKPADRRALYALALARGDRGLLAALLTPAESTAFDLDAALRDLERAYASVYAGEARLHDEPQAFLEAHLREEAQRANPHVRDLLARGVTALQARLERIAADYDLLEERLTDEDYLEAALRLTDFLFWLDEDRAWRWFVPRFVESLAYSPRLRRGLLGIATRWRATLSARGRRRLQALAAPEGRHADADDLETRLRELERLARRGYLKGTDEDERRAILTWLRGQALYAQQRYEEALAAYEEAERGLPPTGEALREELAAALHKAVRRLMWPEDRRFSVYHPAAVRVLRKVTAWLPDDAAAWYHLGVALDDAGEKEAAIEAYRKAIALDAKDPAPWNGLGNVYYDLGRYDEASEAYRKAIALDATYATPWNGLGTVYEAQGDYEKALQHYRKALELDTNFKWAWSNIGNVYRKQGRYDEAIEAYRKAIALDATYATPWNGLGNVYHDLGRYDEAIEAYRKAIALDAKDPVPWNGLGNVYRALGRYDEAIEAHHQAIALDATYAAPWHGLGLVYTVQGNLGQALEAFRKAVELAPEVGVIHLALFGTLLRLGREDEARQEEAIARPLMAKESEYNRACFAALCGEKDEALRLLQRALEKAPGDRPWARRDPDFQALHDDPRFWELVGEDDGP